MTECILVVYDVKRDMALLSQEWKSNISYLKNNKDAKDVEVLEILPDKTKVNLPSKLIVFDTGTNLVIEYQEIYVKRRPRKSS